mmetsp:Transcript_17496/g.34002  ORF Transcript_17496/g.34002 Transcript_17496/m.34002 type:complete len:500 (-) Transcript_17496:300-1799(-)
MKPVAAISLSLLSLHRTLATSSSSSIRGARQETDTPTQTLLKSPRIIGGSESPSTRYPYAVALYDSIGLFCGGSLIAPDVVLTAAHCSSGAGRYQVIVGRHDLESSGGETRSVIKEKVHENYDDWLTDNDFMLVFLDREVESPNAEFVSLNGDGSVPEVGEEVTAMGWGDMDPSDSRQELSDALQHVQVTVMDNDVCRESEGRIGSWEESYKDYITDNMLCARDDGQDSCQGDSGGPLILRGNASDGSQDVQVGIVSWGIGCAETSFPGVYARISKAYDWIQSNTCGPSHRDVAPICGGTGTMQSNNGDLSPSSVPAPSPSRPSQSGGGREPSASSPSGNGNGNRYATLLEEDFDGGYGFFHSGGSDTKHYNSVVGRNGVLRIQNGNGMASSVYSGKITLDRQYSLLRVTFSFLALGMESDDEFCLDFMKNEKKNWKTGRCWNSADDFVNGEWYDDFSLKVDGSKADTLRFRFRCNGNHAQDDVLIDGVKIEGLEEEPF